MFKWFWTILSLGAPDQSDNRETNDKTKPFIHIIHDDKCLSCQNNSSFLLLNVEWSDLHYPYMHSNLKNLRNN